MRAQTDHGEMARLGKRGFAVGPQSLLLTGLLVLFGYRAALLVFGNIPLFPDEAYYADWAHDLSFGYYSKPPIIAWLIRVSTS